MAQMNLSTEQRRSLSRGEQTCGCPGDGGDSGMDWEFGVSGCKLLHLEWISNETLLMPERWYRNPGSCSRSLKNELHEHTGSKQAKFLLMSSECYE